MNTVIITGASRGIGNFLYEAYKADSYEVYGTYNQSSNPINDPHLTRVDVSDYSQVQSWIKKLEAHLDKIVLINCAGIAYNIFTHKSNPEDWAKVIDINLKGSYHAIHALLPLMRSQRYGRIINFSSVLTQLPTMGTSAYTASKAALLGLTKTVAVENAALGITANTISPGYFNIGMGINDVSDKYREQLLKQIPSSQFGDALDLYRTVRYIVETQYLNGSNIEINGGII